MTSLEQKIAQVPAEPGVYLYKNAAGKIIYVGKAKSLRQRVRSYFQETRAGDAKLNRLRADIADLEYIVVDSEMEALALENNLIKQHLPRYNVLLRDDKTFPYLKLSLAESYPRISITRKLKKDGSVYYGPYVRASLAAQAYKLIGRHFQIRTCTLPLNGKRPRPCLDYHIHRCLAPCVDSLCSPEEYGSRVRELRLFMEGKRGDLADRLDAHMREAVAKENFELAAHYRDMLRTIEQLAEPQKISSSQALNLDVFALRREGSQAAVQLFHQREGRVLDRREFFWEDLDENMSDEEVLSSLVKQYYFLTDFTPDEVHLSRPFEDQEALASFLARRLGKKVSIRVPQRGPRRHFLEMAEKNAQLAFQQRFRTAALSAKAVGEELAALLGVEEPPRRIECFDISNLQGTDSVASLVVWEKGSMKKADYRKFLIKTVPGADDFSSLREVVFRRYRRVLEEKQTLPDLILVDGGLGQLHAAAAALDELNLPTHPLASLAKKEEILFVRGSESEPIGLPRHSPLLRLFQQIRDESHRFALTFHRQRRRKRTLITALTRIPGVGNQSSQLLLKKIGSLQQIREASLAELNRHLNPALARRVYLHFHPETEKDPENPGGS